MSEATTIWLIRHGETEWSKSGQHTGVTDLPLTADGEAQAKKLAHALGYVKFSSAFVSPRQRAQKTAELSGVARDVAPIVDADLAEWNYGDYEGITSAQIHEKNPHWSLWTDGAPGGESPAQICARADRLLARVGSLRGDIALVAHGHILRVIALRYLDWPLTLGAQLGLDTATYGRLHAHAGQASLYGWNCAP